MYLVLYQACKQVSERETERVLCSRLQTLPISVLVSIPLAHPLWGRSSVVPSKNGYEEEVPIYTTKYGHSIFLLRINDRHFSCAVPQQSLCPNLFVCSRVSHTIWRLRYHTHYLVITLSHSAVECGSSNRSPAEIAHVYRRS